MAVLMPPGVHMLPQCRVSNQVVLIHRRLNNHMKPIL